MNSMTRDKFKASAPLLLVSVINAKETNAALEGGADVIDVKNPAEGALGAPSPNILSEIVKNLESKKPLSIAIGEFPEKTGAAALAALGAAHFRPDYVKIPFLPTSTAAEIRTTLLEIKKGLASAQLEDISVVAVAYADILDHSSWTLDEFARFAREGGASGCLVDTWAKKSQSLLNSLSFAEIREFINDCHDQGLFCGLAGSLTAQDILTLVQLAPDIIGVRSAACGGDRLRGEVTAKRVRYLKSLY